MKFRQRNLFESKKIFNFLSLEGQNTGKNWEKSDLKQILKFFVTVLSIKTDPQFVK